MKLLNLAWDLLGSDFAGRHAQYEKFYAGPGFVMNGYSYGAGPWQEWEAEVDALLASIGTPGVDAEKIIEQSAMLCRPRRHFGGLVRVSTLCHAFAIGEGRVLAIDHLPQRRRPSRCAGED